MWASRGSIRVAAVLVVALAVSISLAASPPPLQLHDAWVRWVPSVVPNSALYGVFENDGDTDVRLVGGSTAAAKRCMPMITVKTDDGSKSGPVMTMEPVDALVVPAHGTLTLEPGGDHLMLMGLVSPLTVGSEVALTLRFEGADPLTVTVPVAAK